MRVHWFLTQPPAWVHIPVSPGLFPHLLFCSCVCMFNTIFYSRQVDKMYIIHTAKLAGLTSRQVMVMLWLSSKAEYWTYQTERKLNTEWKLRRTFSEPYILELKWLNTHSLCHSYDLTIGLLYLHSCMVPEFQPTACFLSGSIVSSLFHSYPEHHILTEIQVAEPLHTFVLVCGLLCTPFPFVHFDCNSGG